MSERKIDTVILDIGNVLTTFRGYHFCMDFGYDQEMCERIGAASFMDPSWVEYDLGNLTTEEIVDNFVRNDPEIEEELRTVFQDLTGLLQIKRTAIPWINRLHEQGLRVLVLSNMNWQVMKDCPDAFAFLPLVDGGILSYRDHMVKPNADIYELLMKRYDLVGERCVFIDDSQPNLDTAKTFGWHTIQYVNQKQVEAELADLLA